MALSPKGVKRVGRQTMKHKVNELDNVKPQKREYETQREAALLFSRCINCLFITAILLVGHSQSPALHLSPLKRHGEGLGRGTAHSPNQSRQPHRISQLRLQGENGLQ